MTREWKLAVGDWLEAHEMTRTEFARRLGVTKSQITKMLSTTTAMHASVLVPRVCELTGLPPPAIHFGDDRIRRLLEWAYTARESNPAEFERLVNLLGADAAASKAQIDAKKAIETVIARKPKDSRHSRR